MTRNRENGIEPRGGGWRIVGWAAAALLLLLPLLAMRFTEEVEWDLADFAVFGVLLGGAGVTFELAVRKMGRGAYRAAAGISVVTAFVLLWVNGGVGVIGSEDNDANLMFFGVLGIGIVGSIIGRFEARRMARAMFATAIGQVVAALAALIAGMGSAAPMWPWDTLIFTVFFTSLWVGSAMLFRNAARDQPHSKVAGLEK